MTSPMTPSASQNIPLKRKADEHVKDNVEKRRAVVLDVAKRRIAFKQTPLSLETARRSRVAFESFLLDAEERREVLQEVPKEYWRVIAAAGAESTANESLFPAHLKKALDLGSLADFISPSAWSAMVDGIFTLVQYGVQPTDFPSSSSGTRRIPAALTSRCWEVRDEYLSAEQLAILAPRREERRAARTEVERVLKGLDDIELLELLQTDKRKDSPRTREGTAASATSRRSATPDEAKIEEAKQLQEAKRLEQEAKRAAAEEKRQAKEEKRLQKEREEAARETERLRKLALQAKQKATMSSFFKPKVIKTAAPKAVRDFDRVFKGIAERPHVEWAPLNRFRKSADPADSLGQLQTRSRHGLKTPAPFGTMGEMWQQYQDATDPRAVLERIKNNRKFPWKTLSFDQQTRPPYVGTFTKRSVFVGPRTPFAQDPLFDYSYDSSDDWQEDEGGEDVDEEVEADPEIESDESDGEFDDWLDDSDEVTSPPPEMEQTKLPMKQAVKREVKKVVRLAPFIKGPCWEGEGETGLETYRIQLLNDAPCGIDPFTFTSGPAQSFNTTFSTTVVGANSVKTLVSAEPKAQSKPEPVQINDNDAPEEDAKKGLPKVLFPDTHLAELLQLVHGNTRIRTDLVSQLKAHFEGVATKAAIEVKLKQVASRQGKSKDSAWQVRPEVWTAAGLPTVV